MIAQKIIKRVRGNGRGAVFTASDFADIGSRGGVDQALSRLAIDGSIRRLDRGLYDFPKTSAQLGQLSPNLDNIVRAIAKKDDLVLQVSSSAAANMFGLTTQVPAKLTYLTDGRTRSRQIGSQTIYFRKATGKTLVGAGNKTGAVFQALRYVGKNGITDQVIHNLASALTDKDRNLLMKQSLKVASWMRPVVQQIVSRMQTNG